MNLICYFKYLDLKFLEKHFKILDLLQYSSWELYSHNFRRWSVIRKSRYFHQVHILFSYKAIPKLYFYSSALCVLFLNEHLLAWVLFKMSQKDGSCPSILPSDLVKYLMKFVSGGGKNGVKIKSGYRSNLWWRWQVVQTHNLCIKNFSLREPAEQS